MTEFPYNTTYEPALPVCQVVLSTESNQEGVELTAVLDTGADGTIVPVRYLEEIDAHPVFETGLRSQWGERRTVFSYLVNLRIGNMAFPGVYAVGDDLGDDFVLGRDVLNRMRLLFDGPETLTQLLNNDG